MSSRQTDNIEVLSESLGSLQIAYEASMNDKQTDTEISVTLAPMVVTGQKNI